jgi:mRNA interferase RelE/StbE
MKYSLFIHRAVQKKLAKLPTEIYEQIKLTIFALSENPRPEGCLKLTARQGWRFRVRDYRIIYDINDADSSVTILDIDHRGKIYP